MGDDRSAERPPFGATLTAMVSISVHYDGELRCQATHGPSRASLQTDAPTDNHGQGETFSPTDLVATALATCALTTMGIVAQRDGLDMRGATADIEKHMVADPRRRIGRLPMVIRLPSHLDPEQRSKLEHTARHCPVAQSLRPDIETQIRFEYVALQTPS